MRRAPPPEPVLPTPQSPALSRGRPVTRASAMLRSKRRRARASRPRRRLRPRTPARLRAAASISRAPRAPARRRRSPLVWGSGFRARPPGPPTRSIFGSSATVSISTIAAVRAPSRLRPLPERNACWTPPCRAQRARADVISCTGGASPPALDVEDSPFVCTPPEPGGGGTQTFCCIYFAMTTSCTFYPVASCPAGTTGFACMGTDTPEAVSAALSCGAPSPDTTFGGNDFCCSLSGGD